MSIRRFNSTCKFFGVKNMMKDVYLGDSIDFNDAIPSNTGNCCTLAFYPDATARRVVPFPTMTDYIRVPATGSAVEDEYNQIGGTGVISTTKGVENSVSNRGPTTYDTATDEIVIGRDGLYTITASFSFSAVVAISDWVFAASEDSGQTVENLAISNAAISSSTHVTFDHTKNFGAGTRVSFFVALSDTVAGTHAQFDLITYTVEQRF